MARYRKRAQDFTRQQVLTFRTLMVLMLTKSSTSLQLMLNKYLPSLGHGKPTVDKSAYTRARHKLNHAAFIELNQAAVVTTMYEHGDYATRHGLRILATDGSLIQVPETTETTSDFGTMAYDNGQPLPGSSGTHVYARISVLYDVVNRVALDATIAPCVTAETNLAEAHLVYVQPGDLVIRDRGYASYRMLALDSHGPGDSLIRCPSGRFTTATTMLGGDGPDDCIVTLSAPPGFVKDPKNHGLPSSLTVRFVRVCLQTGESEVLVTTLLDQARYPTAIFAALYYQRWGVETFYGILKTRLNLENFSGISTEAIKQDFYATIFLTGAEAILTGEARERLATQKGGQPKQVNTAVSFNQIKEQAFAIFSSTAPNEQRLATLTRLFMTSPTRVRHDKHPPRGTKATGHRLAFWQRRRKMAC